MTSILYRLLALLCCAGLVSCTSGFKSPYDVRGIRVEGVVFPVKAYRLPDSTVWLSFTSAERLRTGDPSIRWVEAAVGPNDTTLSDTVEFNVRELPVPGAPVLLGDGQWSTTAAKTSPTVTLDMGVVNASDHLVFRTTVPIEQASPLTLVPFARMRGDSVAVIGAQATRVYRRKDEYLPSSERLRVIITDRKGNVIWRSDAGMAYLTSVNPVMPEQIGRDEAYSLEWNGLDLNATPVSRGEYEVEIIIPSKPSPYTTKTTLLWTGR